MLGKIKFWKKDDFDFNSSDSNLGNAIGSQAPSQQGFNPSDPLATPLPQTQALGENPFASSQQPAAFAQPVNTTGRELDLVVAKLDALKLTLENINQRLTNLERIAQQSDESYDEYRKRSW